MFKLLLSLITCGTILTAVSMPSQAEAVKIKVEPNITLRQSSQRTLVSPQRVYVPARRIIQERPIIHYYQDPYTGQLYYSYPVPRVDYQPVYSVESRTTGADFGVTFKIR